MELQTWPKCTLLVDFKKTNCLGLPEIAFQSCSTPRYIPLYGRLAAQLQLEVGTLPELYKSRRDKFSDFGRGDKVR